MAKPLDPDCKGAGQGVDRAPVGGGPIVLGNALIRNAAYILLFLLIILTACNSQTASPTPLLKASPPAPTPALANASPAPPTYVPTVQAASAITLTVWAPEEFTTEAAQGGQVLQQQIEAFASEHPTIHVNYVLKSSYGQGGLLDFLLQVQSLVPARLPDIVVLDSREVDAAANAELLQPLEQDLPAGAMVDLLPPAQKLARYAGHWLVLPWTLDVEHLAYNKQAVAAPPSTWDKMLASDATLAFAGDDDEAFLFQYLQNHGRLPVVKQSSPLDVSVITAVLTFFQKARAANLVPDSALAIKSAHDVWPLFADGQTPLAEVDASDYLANGARVANAGYAPLPTQDGSASALVSSWNYAIVTSDPERHAAAAELLDWLDDPARLAEWAGAAHLIPARRSAFVQAVAPSDYADFLRNLIANGLVAPTFAERAPYEAGWHSALQAVLRGQSTPSEAAVKAAQAPAP